ncbi:hypothetical protein [Chryseobacterium scophthalmum]|uniref:hypothetical protein n=1 Tax=Chryseobacterium scophthalmum TaxID=59733 RepID=UPI001AEC23D0|nr:hypothetical protein [Chryseobacterium scophthalmum]
MKIDIENKLLLKLMTFVPPFFGIVFFSYIVKFSNNTNVSERLPIYQGISSYYSLILIGFTYIKNRNAIDGKKITLPLLFILLLPLVGYYFAHVNIVITLLLLIVSFLSSIILYLLLVKKKMFYYLLFSIINSILLPITLLANYYVFVFLIVFLLGIFFCTYNWVKADLVPFDYKEAGAGILSSIFLHSPYILLPFFDFIIRSAIGVNEYNNYVLLNKYINGGITLLFSYKQLSLMFSGELKKINIIIITLINILLFSALGLLFDNLIIFAIMIGLYSLGVNLSSLIIRSKLMEGGYFGLSIIGVIFTGLYVACIFLFKNLIKDNNNMFVFFMTMFTIIPSFILSFNLKKTKKTF